MSRHRVARLVSAPGRWAVRKLCAWKLRELRQYERIMKALVTDSRTDAERAHAGARMLVKLREEIAMLERAQERVA